MKEMIFEISGLIKDKSNIEEIEFWGHDAGEFFVKEELGTPEKESLSNVKGAAYSKPREAEQP